MAPRRFAVTGTPTDAVNLALKKLFADGRRPDLVISGVNGGENLGDDVTYSGTISAAVEGGAGRHSGRGDEPGDARGRATAFAAAEFWAANVLAPLLDLQMAKRTRDQRQLPRRCPPTR